MSAKFRNAILTETFIAFVFAMNAPPASAQTQGANQLAKVNTATSASKAIPSPVFEGYRGIKIGTPVSEVRDALERYVKAKGDKQDLLILSDNETAQIYYDSAGKVTAISIDYLAKNDHAPTAIEVLGVDIAPKPDGSVYALKRYPAAGYWVSYNRTSGESPTITVTMQVLQ